MTVEFIEIHEGEDRVKQKIWGSDFLTTPAEGAGLDALANPIRAAAQSAGVKAGDLPDLTIKEVKVYVTDTSKFYRRLNGETGELVAIVTNGGIEGNYTLGNRNPTAGWLEWAKAFLVGKSVVDLLPTLTSTSGLKGRYGFNGARRGATASAASGQGGGTFRRAPSLGEGSAFDSAAITGSGLMTHGGGNWPNYYTAAADVCMWDILGKIRQPAYLPDTGRWERDNQGQDPGVCQLSTPRGH